MDRGWGEARKEERDFNRMPDKWGQEKKQSSLSNQRVRRRDVAIEGVEGGKKKEQSGKDLNALIDRRNRGKRISSSEL